MKYLITALFAAILLLATPALACVSGVTITDTFVRINIGGALCTVFYDSLRQGNPDTLQATNMQQRLQDCIDVRLLRTSIENDDPDRQTDPKSANFFWGDVDGNPTPDDATAGTHLIARSCVVTDVTWDGTQFSPTISVP